MGLKAVLTLCLKMGFFGGVAVSSDRFLVKCIEILVIGGIVINSSFGPHFLCANSSFHFFSPEEELKTTAGKSCDMTKVSDENLPSSYCTRYWEVEDFDRFLDAFVVRDGLNVIG